MTEMVEGQPAGSDRTLSEFRRLHPMTKFLVVVTLLYLMATIMTSISYVVHPSPSWAAAPLSEHLALEAKSIAYALTLFGGAASVEFLFRIWDELKRTRTGD
jgi:hypothetical protein